MTPDGTSPMGGASRAAHGRSRTLRAARAVAVAVLVGVLTGCAAGAPAVTPTSAKPSPSATATGETLPDPRTITGPSTAASIAEIVPVEKSPKPSLPVTVTDTTGTSVTVTDTSRILALDIYGTLAETVVGLGLGDKLVGRGSSNTLDVMKDLPLVTQNGHELNGEAILALRPTLVLTDTTLGPREVQDQLRASGVPVLFFDPKRSIATIGEQTRAVAHAVGLDAVGEKLVERTDEELVAAKADIAKLAPRSDADKLRIAFLYVRGTAGVFFLFGKGMGADDLISGVGAVDVASAAGITGAKPANSEALLATNPDVFLMMTDGLESTGGVDGLLKRPGVADTLAGQHRRIVDMSDGQILSFGPTTPAVLRSLADALYRPGATG
ncbi:ABC transporter substrate-binding protein [Leifsonia sp. LS1]|uniref:heme/hemin ABC transporter substrate-binding protein n=1 Tax=Leifsonia sp. LS1 TaxID=2828483 RepID=UPI001CFCF983|nr:ABC transporter substrate-binding protein [Leifsonia sp. LS1]GIT81361.1 ABC transporter substrate-binding protein [Leifsonia sp. LS1]